MRPALLAILAGCRVKPDVRPECAVLRVDPDLPNHVQPYTVAVDSDRRLAWSVALANPNIAAVDLDSGELAGVYPVGGRLLEFPEIAVDAAGAVWLTSRRSPAVIRFDPEEERETPHDALGSAHAVAALPGGGVLVAGRDAAGEPVIQRYDAAGPGRAIPTGEIARGLVRLGEGVGLLLAAELAILDENLVEIERCDLPFSASRGAQLADGAVLVAEGARVGRAGCGGEPAAEWAIGADIKDVVPVGDAALALDRRAPDDPGRGAGWWVDAAGPLAEPPLATGKHSGFGGYDAATGALWVNSEGSSELWGIDLASGEPARRVRTGVFLDGLALDPGDARVAYATGRLSDTVVRLAGRQAAAWTDAVPWPYSPVLTGDTLWVLSQSEGVVYALDPTTLAALAVLDPGLGRSALLTFGSLAFHEARGSLWLAHSERDIVVELDPQTGSERGRWDLGGPLIADPDEIGELAALADPLSGAVLLVRTSDGRVQRIVPGRAEVQTAWFPEVAAGGAGDGAAMDMARLLPEAGLLYVGGAAIDAATLERRPERDLPLSRIVGRDPEVPGAVLGLDGRRLVRLGRDGQRLSALPYSDRDLSPVIARIDAAGRVVLTRGAQASVCPFVLE